jgi:hypothetical protein
MLASCMFRYDFPEEAGISGTAESKVSASSSMAAELNADPRGPALVFHSVVTVRFQCDQHITVNTLHL